MDVVTQSLLKEFSASQKISNLPLDDGLPRSGGPFGMLV